MFHEFKKRSLRLLRYSDAILEIIVMSLTSMAYSEELMIVVVDSLGSYG